MSDRAAATWRRERSRCTAPATGAATRRATSASRASSPSPAASYPDDVHQPALDHAPVRRVRHRGGNQPALPPAAGRGADRASRPRSTCRPRWGTTPTIPWRRARSGGSGVAIDTVDDLALLFRGIPLDRVSTSMTINATAAILLAMYVVVGEEQGVARSRLTGTVQNDILKEYIARGHLHLSGRALALRLVDRHLPVRRGRGDELQSDLHQRLSHAGGGRDRRAGGRRSRWPTRWSTSGAVWTPGLPLDAFGPRLSFFFAAHNDLFEEAAKFRAARRLWARLVRERFRRRRPDRPAPLPHPDGRRDAAGAAAAQQRRAGDGAGALRRARRHPVAAHQRLRRGAGAADRGGRHAGAPDPADPRATRAA